MESKEQIISDHKNGENLDQNKKEKPETNEPTLKEKKVSRRDSKGSHDGSIKEKKKSKKSKRKKSNSRSSSKGKKKKNKRSRSRSSERKKKSKKHHKSKKHRERSESSRSSRSSDKKASINKILEKDSKDKKRSRTRSPPRFPIQKNKPPGGGGNILEFDPAKPKYFWDGFQWVARTNSVPNIDPNILNQTRKMRRVQISNLPLYMGLTEKDINQIVSKFLIDNYLNDDGNTKPVLSTTLNHQGNYAVMEISSVEEANRLIKIENIKIFNHNCKITRVGESMYGQTMNLQTLVTNAQTSAQAQAAALVALQSLQNKEGTNTASFTLGKTCITPPSNVIKVTNVIANESFKTMNEENYDDVQSDIFAMFGQQGTVINGFIVRPHQASIGAEVGSIFLEFCDKENSEKAMNNLTGKKYNNKEIKMIFIPEEVFNKNFKGLQELK